WTYLTSSSFRAHALVYPSRRLAAGALGAEPGGSIHFAIQSAARIGPIIHVAGSLHGDCTPFASHVPTFQWYVRNGSSSRPSVRSYATWFVSRLGTRPLSQRSPLSFASTCSSLATRIRNPVCCAPRRGSSSSQEKRGSGVSRPIGLVRISTRRSRGAFGASCPSARSAAQANRIGARIAARI